MNTSRRDSPDAAVPTARPNLFHFATSELSQDAFLGWLLAWADHRHKDSEPDLHEAGMRFLNCLFALQRKALPAGHLSVHVRKQWEKMDVVAEVVAEGDDPYAVVIEDKTYTSHHSGQLATYAKKAVKEWGKDRVVLVYVKIGDQDNYDWARSFGWAPCTRRVLLEALTNDAARKRSDIYADFVDHIRAIEARVQAYATTRPEHWQGHDPWKGFFAELQTQLGEGGWCYVANPSGGFMGFYWAWASVPGGRLYLQLEHDKLCVKVEAAKGTERRDLRTTWSQKVLRAPTSLRWQRPAKFGSGRWMTVAILDGSYRQTGDEGTLDLEATIALLKSATTFVKGLPDDRAETYTET